MLSKIDKDIGFVQSALNARAMRQEVLASNLANADTPNYKARDVDFAAALNAAKGAAGGNLSLTRTDSAHIAASGSGSALGNGAIKYRAAVQPSLDGNTVDLDVERAAFTENAMHYQFLLERARSTFQRMSAALEPSK
jgi:flagellar basal-body rod protein FlgB